MPGEGERDADEKDESAPRPLDDTGGVALEDGIDEGRGSAEGTAQYCGAKALMAALREVERSLRVMSVYR